MYFLNILLQKEKRFLRVVDGYDFEPQLREFPAQAFQIPPTLTQRLRKQRTAYAKFHPSRRKRPQKLPRPVQQDPAFYQLAQGGMIGAGSRLASG